MRRRGVLLPEGSESMARRFRIAAFVAAGVGYAGALGALLSVVSGSRALAGLALLVLAPVPMAIGPFRMRRFLGSDPPPAPLLSAFAALGVVFVALGAPSLVILPAAMCALQGHLLVGLADDRTAAWSPPVAVLQVLSALALTPGVLTAALVPLVLMAAVAAQMLLLARITRRSVAARALGAQATAEDATGALRRVAYAVPLTGVLLLVALLASPLASTPPWRLADSVGFGEDGQRRAPVENALAEEDADTDHSMGFSSDIATNGIPMPAYEILMEVVPRDATGDLGDIGPLHLRGIVLSEFTPLGVRMRGTHQPTRYRDDDDGVRDGTVRLENPAPGEAIELWISHYPLPIDPQGWNLLFSIERPFAVRLDEVRYDPDRLLVGTEVPADWFSYVVEAGRPGSRKREIGNRPARHDDGRYVQLPPATPELTRVVDAGRTLTTGARSDLERVECLVTHFRTEFEYSLEDTEFDGADGLAEFLDRRSGFCTQYASACVLMLRGQGLPARVVTGFLASEWNDSVAAYQVRPRDTHAWFEVHFDSLGWVSFDATPPDLRAQALSASARAAEPGALAWAGALMDRIGALATSSEAGVTPRDVLETLLSAPTGVRRSVILAAALLVATLLVLRFTALVGRRGLLRSKSQREIEGLYGRILELLARRGFRKHAASTPREFARSVIRSGGVGYRPLARITEDLYAARFGGRPLDGAAKQRIDEFVGQLKGPPATG